MDPIEGMESVVASVSGYHGSQRFQLIKLIAHTGANYVGAMNKSTTHLVCWRFEGKKYDFARNIGAQIVSHRWFEECLKSGKRIPEGPYVMESGEEAGPILWEVPTLVHGKNKETDVENTVLSDCSNFTGSGRNVKTHKRKSNFECSSWTSSLLPGELSERDDELSNNSFWHRARHQTSIHNFIHDNNTGKQSKKNRRLLKMESKIEGNGHLITDSSLEQDKQSEINNLFETGEGCSSNDSGQIFSECKENDELILNKQTQQELSCVICWTEFSPIRGVLPCGHRFCYTCIEDWANRLISGGKSTTCPLCKALFTKIMRVEDADTSDQKIYSQTVPSGSLSTEIFISAGRDHNFQTLHDVAVCYACHNHEPQDLLLNCDICHSKWVHSYCLDPPQFPWTCVDCRELSMLYRHLR